MVRHAMDREDERSVTKRFFTTIDVAVAVAFIPSDAGLYIDIDTSHLDCDAVLLNEWHMLDRYPKYLDVKFSMFRELIKIRRNHTSQCVFVGCNFSTVFIFSRFAVYVWPLFESYN